MTHSDFSIGREFISGGRRWRCTDVGTRTILKDSASTVLVSADHE